MKISAGLITIELSGVFTMVEEIIEDSVMEIILYNLYFN